jgi:hypothetical protein
MKDNWNNYTTKEGLDKWHKVDKQNFIPPKNDTNLVFYSKGGQVFCGHYKNGVGFVCYGVSKKELTDVEVTHWMNLKHPDEFQQMLDDMDMQFHECQHCNNRCNCNEEICKCCNTVTCVTCKEGFKKEDTYEAIGGHQCIKCSGI